MWYIFSEKLLLIVNKIYRRDVLMIEYFDFDV